MALTALLLASCGEGEGAQVRRTVDEFTAALARGDGAAACERLAEAGVAELLYTAVRADVPPDGLEEPRVHRCARIAERLAADSTGLPELRQVRKTRTLLEGDVATVETNVGHYELEEVQGRWKLTRFDPIAAVLAGGVAPVRPVGLTIGRPELSEPALGPALAGRTRRKTIELTGTVDPEHARIRIEPSGGTRVRSFEARDGRLRAELDLRQGVNEVLLSASAPGRAATEVAVRITRE